MRLDYNEKKQLGREKVERRAVQKNRPRKEPMGIYAFLVVFVLAATYGAGVFTGWFFFEGEPPRETAAVPPAVQPAAPAPPPVAPGEEEPLTFYKTLPQGGGAVMGSGVNLKLPETAPAAKPAPASAAQGTQPQAAQPQAPASQPQPQAAQPQAEKQEKPEKPEKQNKPGQDSAAKEQKEDDSRFAVQIASYREKEEAAAAQAKLAARGLSAYLVESRLADKSVWYRLRVGRNLSKSEAGQLAAKAGKGAVLIPE